jgi:hypothetical protein
MIEPSILQRLSKHHPTPFRRARLIEPTLCQLACTVGLMKGEQDISLGLWRHMLLPDLGHIYLRRIKAKTLSTGFFPPFKSFYLIFSPSFPQLHLVLSLTDCISRAMDCNEFPGHSVGWLISHHRKLMVQCQVNSATREPRATGNQIHQLHLTIAEQVITNLR